jgi:hypothetical protein
MVTFDPYSADQNVAFDRERERLCALVDDMEKIRSGTPPGQLAEGAPILDHWALAHRPEVCLVGRSTGHPRLTGQARPIVTSCLWLMSKDQVWARTLFRWYRLGRPADNPGRDA